MQGDFVAHVRKSGEQQLLWTQFLQTSDAVPAFATKAALDEGSEIVAPLLRGKKTGKQSRL